MTLTLNKMDPRNPAARRYTRAARLRDGVLTPCAISANADPTKFNTSAFSYAIGGKVYTKAASLANVFSAVHATGIAAWLGIGLYVDANGNITTVANPNTGDQDYATEALALASIPKPAPGTVLVATITLLTTAADWDANTDALDAADLAASNLLSIYPDRRWLVQVPGDRVQILTAQAWCRSLAGTFQAEVLSGKAGSTYDQVVTRPFLEVDRRTIANPTVTKLRFAGFDYRIDGVLYHTDAQKALAFTAAHVVALDKWGAILLLINEAGVYSTLVGEATQTTAMAYTSAAAARAALPAVPAGKIAIGILVVEADGSTWTANTDDIVAGSDLEDFQLVPALPDRGLSNVTLAIDAIPERFQSTAAFTFTNRGVKLSKAAAAAIQFTAAHHCTASKFLPILVSIDSAGAVTTRVPLIDGLSQTATQGFDSYAAAVAALPTPLADLLPIGYIVVLADAGGWIANTDDMTPGSDLTNAWFVGLTPTVQLGFGGLAATRKNDLWPVTGAAYAASVPTNAVVPTGTRPVRGDIGCELAIYAAAKTDAAADDVDLTVISRPWPMAGDGVSPPSFTAG